ncbi:MAG: hypothetical protein R3C03_17040 [Pirellulaceae bacterium]
MLAPFNRSTLTTTTFALVVALAPTAFSQQLVPTNTLVPAAITESHESSTIQSAGELERSESDGVLLEVMFLAVPVREDVNDDDALTSLLRKLDPANVKVQGVPQAKREGASFELGRMEQYEPTHQPTITAVVDESMCNQFINQIRNETKGAITSAPKVATEFGKAASVRDGTFQSTVNGAVVHKGDFASAAEPEVGLVYHGSLTHLLATPDSDGVNLDVNFVRQKVDDVLSFAVGGDVGTSGQVMIQQPQVTVESYQANRVVSSGSSMFCVLGIDEMKVQSGQPMNGKKKMFQNKPTMMKFYQVAIVKPSKIPIAVQPQEGRVAEGGIDSRVKR